MMPVMMMMMMMMMVTVDDGGGDEDHGNDNGAQTQMKNLKMKADMRMNVNFARESEYTAAGLHPQWP